MRHLDKNGALFHNGNITLLCFRRPQCTVLVILPTVLKTAFVLGNSQEYKRKLSCCNI